MILMNKLMTNVQIEIIFILKTRHFSHIFRFEFFSSSKTRNPEQNKPGTLIFLPLNHQHEFTF
jgi:hypothetical protein